MVIVADVELQENKYSNIPLIIGYFGSIHIMHNQILTRFANFNILTFKNIPGKKSLYSDDERLQNLAKYKPDNIYVLDLKKHNMTAHKFINTVLKQIYPSEILVGSDFHFGSDHKDVWELKKFFKVHTLAYNPVVSTTKIMELLSKGEIEKANDWCALNYYYSSKWISGRKIGRKLGCRTINLDINHPLALADGAYVTKTYIGLKSYQSISFIGKSKTTYSTKRCLETHILNRKIPPKSIFPQSIRNKIKIEFLKEIRPNIYFESASELKAQLEKDKQFAHKYFKGNI